MSQSGLGTTMEKRKGGDIPLPPKGGDGRNDLALAPDLALSRRVLKTAAIAAFVVFLSFLPSLNNGFVNWDDNGFVYENTVIRSMDAPFWSWIFQFHEGNWCPLTWVSHALDYALWGLKPAGHHLTSVLLHSLNTFLFILLVVRLFALKSMVEVGKRSDPGRRHLVFSLVVAVSAGLFFGLSPLRVESVVWISERRDVLFLFFGLLSILAYLKAREKVLQDQGQRHFFILSILGFCAGLMSKSMLMTLPVVLLLIDIYPLGRLRVSKGTSEWKAALLEKVPFFILAGASSIVTYMSQSFAAAIYPLERFPLVLRFWVSIRAYMFYLYKTLNPSRLSCLYLVKSPIVMASLPYVGSLVLFVLITAACLLLYRKAKWPLLIWGFYVVTLLPVIGIVQVGNQFAADRYTYFPGLGLALLFGLALGAAYRKLVPPSKLVSRGAVLTGAVGIAVLGMNLVLLQAQIPVWKNSLSLWNQAIERSPRIIETPFKNRGAAYFESGDFQRAIEDFTTAIGLNPSDDTLFANRAQAWQRSGDSHRAQADFVTAARMGNSLAQKYLLSQGIHWQ